MEQRLCTERVTSGDARRLFASTSLEKQWLHLALNSPHLFLPGRTTAKIGPTHSSTERETLVPGSTFALETLHSARMYFVNFLSSGRGRGGTRSANLLSPLLIG